MASTTFSGPVTATNGFVGNITGGIDGSQGYVTIYSTAATSIADIADAVNTSDKQAGTLVFDTTNSKLKIATGSNANSTWVDADGTNAVTPA
jgi:hypothetical protein